MRIAIMGAGGIGAFFGANLVENNDVIFVARGDHAAAMRENGLRITSSEGDLIINPVDVTENPHRIDPVDVVLFCVKLYDTEAAAEAIAPMVGPDTRVLTLQNGVDGAEMLAAHFGRERVLGGVAYISAKIDAPGVVSYLPGITRILFGTLDGRKDDVAGAFLAACEDAPFDAEMADDIHAALWTKMVLLSTLAGLSATSRRTIRDFFADEAGRPVTIAALDEAAAVGRACGANLPDDVVDDLAGRIGSLPEEMRASMYYDLINGKRIELDGLCGAIVRLGREHGIPTPVQATFYALLDPFKDGAPAEEEDEGGC